MFHANCLFKLYFHQKKKKKKIINLLSADIFTQHAKHLISFLGGKLMIIEDILIFIRDIT